MLDRLADMLIAKLNAESSTLPILRKQLDEIEKGIDNLVNAIQAGILTASTKQRLEQLEVEKSEISVQILKEEIAKPTVTKEDILAYLIKYRKLNMKQLDHRRRLIDSFVNAIYLFDDYLVITFNYKEGTKTITFAEIEEAFGSDLSSLTAPYRVFITKVMNTRYFFAYIFLFRAGFLLFFLLLCRGGQIVNCYALSALKGDLSLSVPFGNLQTANKAIMDDHALCAVLARSLNLINLDLFNQFTKDDGVQRFHLHKAPYRLDEVLLGLPLLSKAVELFSHGKDVFLGFIHLYLVLVRELHKPFVRNLAVYVVLVNLFI